MHRSSSNSGLFVVAAAAIVLATLGSPSAQRRGNTNASFGAPVATNTLLDDPNSYFGKQVTVSAAVEETVSKTAFLIDQRKVVGGKDVQAIGKPVLVIAPYLTKPVERATYLLVTGQVVKFDATAVAAVAAGYTLDLPVEIATKYAGQPVLVAISILDPTYAELGRKPVPPARPDEVAMSTAMKSISAALATVRTATQAADSAVVARNAATIQPLFTSVEVTWDDLGQRAAAQWARDARAHAAAIETAATAGNWDEVRSSTASLNQLCGSCHGAYRDRLDDGSFRFRVGAF